MTLPTPSRALLRLAAAVLAAGCYSQVVRREVVYVDPPPAPVAKPVAVSDNTQRRASGNPAKERAAPQRRTRPPPPRVVDGKPKKPDELPPPPVPAEPEDRSPPVELAAGLDPVMAEARAHVGKNAVRVNGVSFRYDCSGYVRGMFSKAGVDIMALGYEYPDLNGVGLIFNYVDRFGRNHRRTTPRPGEMVYFDDTWDKNGNGRLDDPLTHVGIVDAVDPDGTFYVLHKAGRGIVRDPMNVIRPNDRTDGNGKAINGFLRPKTAKDPDGTPHVMGDMWAGFGTLGQAAPNVSMSSSMLFGSSASGGPGPFTDFANGFEPEPVYTNVIE